MARLWGCTPAALRDCTKEEYDAIVAQLLKEAEIRSRRRR